MSTVGTVVTEIPKSTRAKKYDYEALLDGRIHRLVEGKDFTIDPKSVRGALYNHKAAHNKANPAAQIGLTVQFRTETEGTESKTVIYVQRTEVKERKKRADAKSAPVVKSEPEPKADKPKGGKRAPVTPSAAQRAAAADAAK